ncbi:MAG: YfbM family protein, partial [Actinomycetota bacterium]|nr:YfbM family protein [Actinomycetota bacterium]
CSFTAAPDEDHLDMGWWPAILERAWERSGADASAVLRHALNGGGEVNPAYRDHPDTVWEHPVTALEPPRVDEIAQALRAVPPEAVRAAVPSTPDEIEAALGGTAREVVGDLAEQLARQHTVLRDFYTGAARQRLAVVLWWD